MTAGLFHASAASRCAPQYTVIYGSYRYHQLLQVQHASSTITFTDISNKTHGCIFDVIF